MKLPVSKINAFLTKPDPSVRVILVYGPDAGLVRERVMTLAKITVSDLNDPFRTATLTSSAIAEDHARLFDEMAAQALGGGRRLIRMQSPSETIAPLLTKLLSDMPSADSLLLIEGGDLDKRSKIRAVCEGDSPLACGIPCYIEDTMARQRTISEILKAENVKAGGDVVAMLADMLPPDRLAMRSELEKFAVYVGAHHTATQADIHATIQDGGAAELDDLVFAVGGGDAKRTVQLIDHLYAEQTSVVAILRAAQRHFMRLQWARAQMDNGLNATDAVKRLQPPVFWKHESAMAGQLRRWPRARAEQALRRLYEAEAAVKRTGTPDTALCAHVLLGLSA